ncbi:phosphate/phosphite/phosphonate ABC transporter substrate-binding protein [Rhodococcus triatomae]|uniref:Phosphonate transport system substrate-binding protein n=1 Tax=Rhodococcus triatomae TaxID=300028 RepID=A0A1G8LKX0_9NOCA|nr:phosphate/phosphite/phosphonate ABC transporter substrate-binding protein [Rhodococcus triatomae]QNG20607.1 phosphate/phosphite/phosphonate ABC transporter substrate-binding protein [Rhodococcus triatomae]QNG23475.1 phosphate/phosphite/phosphonate ABC transporter substrate-binding protein [Rhodococcus triatomae]SDI55860.1 phosphonate transport system substrate-binding protein [Rhodococcus triatomae]
MGTTLRTAGCVAGVLVSTAVIAACGSSAAESAEPAADTRDKLVFAAIPSEESQSLQQRYRLVIEVIEDETGLPVEFQNATDYAAVIEAQRAGKADIAGYGPFSYVTARDSGVGTTPVASAVDAADIDPGYYAYGIAHPGAGISGLADMRGRNVCFVDPASTSGYLYPSAGLVGAGIDPATDLNAVYAGGHDAVVFAVASGQCDAGFATQTMVEETLPGKGQLEDGDVQVVWTSELIAGSPITISDHLPADLRDQLTDIFRTKLTRPALVEAGYCDDEASCDLPDSTGYGYVPIDDSHFAGVREVCATTRAQACTG